MNNHEELSRWLDEQYPLIPHTHAGQLFSTVRHMKIERELAVPIKSRTAFVISP
jgi:hypothetical protein